MIAKRPIANAVWRLADKPNAPHLLDYWERLQKLRYDFLQGDRAFETALRFTLGIPGVHTAIIGTTNPSHVMPNAKYAAAGPLEADAFAAIRARWKQVAAPGWVDQV